MEIATGVSPGAVNFLKREVIHAYKSIPKRGAESGGLLCGHLTPKLHIEEIVPVPIEYRFGPTYRLSDTDIASFQRAIADHPNVIGWYRSQARKTEGITDEDRELTRRFFGEAESAFLICVPDAQYNVNGKLHLWKDGSDERTSEFPLGKFSLLEDALQSADEEGERMPSAAEQLRHRITPIIPEPLPPVFRTIPAPAFAARAMAPKQVSPMLRAALIGGIVLTLLAGTGIFFRNQIGPGSGGTVHANTIGLGMKVDRQGKALLVNWDRQSAAILEATDATFTIKEGERSRILRLSPSELRNGGVFYTPQTRDDVHVELALHGPGGNFAQSIRIVQDQ